MRRFYGGGLDTDRLTNAAYYRLARQMRRVRNLEAGKPADGTWFERNTVPGTARPAPTRPPKGKPPEGQ